MAPPKALTDDPGGEDTEDTQELRIAPVVVGGVSLAIWMGGLMYELERLCRKDGAYQALCSVMDVNVRVDVLSGTSAGGINAAAFALAQRRGSSIAQLRDLWLQVGALDNLLRDPYETKPPSLLRGDEVMLASLHSAFGGVLGAGIDPLDKPLRLFLTGTYLRGEISRYRDDYGTLIADASHAALFHFNEEQLAPPPANTPDVAAAALALAARTSASFPYAFEPSTVPVLATSPTGWPAADDLQHPVMAAYLDATVNHLMVDGGVLANRPIGPTLQAIFEQTAEKDVRRVLAYVTPTSSSTIVQPTDAPPPQLVSTTLAQVAGAMLSQSISSDLERLREHNTRVGLAHRSRLLLADLASVSGQLPVDDAVWTAYRVQRVDREAGELLAEATRQIRVAAALGQVPTAWAVGAEGIQATPRGWSEALCVTRTDALAAAISAAAQWSGPPVSLGLDLFEAARAAALPLLSLVRAVVRWAGRWDQMTELNKARHELRIARDAANPHPHVQAYDAVHTALRATPPNAPGTVIPLLEGIATAWPPVGDPQKLQAAWNALGELVRVTAIALDTVVPLGTPAAANQPDVTKAEAEARPLLTHLTFTGTGPEQIAVQLAKLIVVQEALDGRPGIDQPVEVVQMSSDTRTELTRSAEGTYTHSAAEQKLAGLQLHHFGAFYKAAWRANDWMWGRLDGAGWLTHLLLDPRRIRQRFPDAETFVAKLEEARLLAVEVAPDVRTRAVDALKDVFGDSPPRSLPDLALLVAAGMQADIAAEEIPVLAAQIRSDQKEGVVEGRDLAFLRHAASLKVPGQRRDEVAQARKTAQTALKLCDTGQQTIAQDSGSNRFVTTAATTVAVVAATLDAAVAHPPGFVSTITRSMRSVGLMLYVMSKGLRQAGALGVATGVAIAVAGTSAGAYQTTAVTAAALLLLLLLARGLRVQEHRTWPLVIVITLVAAVLVFAAIAGLLPDPVKNWPLDGVTSATNWMKQRWWVESVVVLAVSAWILLPLLDRSIRGQTKRREKQRHERNHKRALAQLQVRTERSKENAIKV